MGLPAVITAEANSPSGANGGGGGGALLSSPVDDDPAGETLALEHARRDIESDPSAALAVLRRFDEQYPDPMLDDDRARLEVQALQHSGRLDEARTCASQLMVRYPRSPVALRSRHLVQSPA